jgi:hypothetical protein
MHYVMRNLFSSKCEEHILCKCFLASASAVCFRFGFLCLNSRNLVSDDYGFS